MSGATMQIKPAGDMRLYWKESRQLLPLIAALLATGFVLGIGIAAAPSEFQYATTFRQVVPFLLPALYCVGAPAMLVSQERELKTMQWLTSLPISSGRLIRVKLLTALLGLGVMWIGCWLLLVVQSLLTQDSIAGWGPFPQYHLSGKPHVEDTLMLHLNSVYILACAFVAVWSVRNTFVSLALILPLAMLPPLLIAMGIKLYEWSTGRHVVDSTPIGWPAVVQLALTLGMIWVGIRAAYAALGPAASSGMIARSIDSTLAVFGVRRIHRASSDVDGVSRAMIDRDVAGSNAAWIVAREPFRFSITALWWQFVRQNPWGLGTLIVLMSLSTISIFVLLSKPNILKDFSAIGQMLAAAVLYGGFFGLSWLGVLVFSGDGASARLRFLADRGVSPTKVWLSRQLFCLSIVACFAIVLAVGNLLIFRHVNSGNIPAVSLATIWLLLWSVYSVSQWTAQNQQMLGVSMVAAPVLSSAMIFWLVTTTFTLGVPYWLNIGLIALPMVGTWLAMPHYMDGPRSWYRRSIAGGTLLLVIGLPFAFMLIQRERLRSMDSVTEAAWQSESATIIKQTPDPRSLRLTQSIYVDAEGNVVDDPFVVEDPLGDPASNEAEIGIEMGMGMSAYELKPNVFKVHVPADLSSDKVDTILMPIDVPDLRQDYGRANRAKLAVQNTPDDQKAVELLAQWIENLSWASHGLRKNPSLLASANADIVEIWLTRTLRMPELQPHLDQPSIAAAIERLRDTTFRNASRRRAVLADWHRATQTEVASNRLPFPFEWERMSRADSPLVASFFKRRRVDVRSMILIEMIEAGSAGESTEPMRRQLHELNFGDLLSFENGPYAERFRADGDEQSIAVTPDGSLVNFVGSQWFAGWEETWNAKRSTR